MTGGAKFAPVAATFEGQRILMKAAARQLGPQGIRVNAIAVAPELVLANAEAAEVHYLAPGAILGERSPADVVDVISFLTSHAGRHFSGQTLTVDGGNWLAP
jgi:3-oxoacyl-[acyl-carrier protein] reductase